MPNSEVRRDLRRARWQAWWSAYDQFFYLAGMLVCGLMLGGFVTSFVDRAERMELSRRHSDDVRDFRIACRKTVDERDEQVRQAGKVVADVLSAAGDNDPKTAPRAAVPAVKRAPPVDMSSAVRSANEQINGARP